MHDLRTMMTGVFHPHIQQAVTRGLITEAEADGWTAKVREAFSDRVYWQG